MRASHGKHLRAGRWGGLRFRLVRIELVPMPARAHAQPHPDATQFLSVTIHASCSTRYARLVDLDQPAPVGDR